MLLALLVGGLGEKLFGLTDSAEYDFIGAIKRAAVVAARDSDEIVAFHSSCAVRGIGELMRNRLFPTATSNASDRVLIQMLN